MLFMTRPNEDTVHQVLQGNGRERFTYEEVGATLGLMPAGWHSDEQSVVLGHGETLFADAVSALRSWTHFDLPWVRAIKTDVAIRPGSEFAFLAKALGVWSINVCRVIYVVDESDFMGKRFGFAYGTVAPHTVQGEEQFWLEWDRPTDCVTFSIRKFSRPNGILLTLLKPITHRIQRRFTTDALSRLADEVSP